MRKILLALLTILIVGCDDFNDGCVGTFQLNDYISLTITEKETQDTYWKIGGIAINEGEYSTPDLWYIQATFLADSMVSAYWDYDLDSLIWGMQEDYSTYKFKEYNTPLEPGDTLYWELYNYNNNISDYPDIEFEIGVLEAISGDPYCDPYNDSPIN